MKKVLVALDCSDASRKAAAYAAEILPLIPDCQVLLFSVASDLPYNEKELAREIVSIFHGDDAVAGAEENFQRTIQKGQLPEDMPSHVLSQPVSVVDVLAELEMVKSKSEARRQMQQGAVRLEGDKVTDISAEVSLESGQSAVLQVGKRKFVRLEGA